MFRYLNYTVNTLLIKPCSKLFSRNFSTVTRLRSGTKWIPESAGSAAISKTQSFDHESVSLGSDKNSLQDHRSIASSHELFFSSSYSPGAPLFWPDGADIFNKLVSFIRAQYSLWGYREVITPNVFKSTLWNLSGHNENYAKDMFHVINSPVKSNCSREKMDQDFNTFGLKPMNCPGHCLLYKSKRRSYRDLPIRYVEFATLHRNEIASALSGLTRLRRFHQDDGHIFCSPSQVEQEILECLEFIRRVYTVCGYSKFNLLLSSRPLDNYIGTPEEWDIAEASLCSALTKFGQPWSVNKGDGAFYGPKIDITLRDSDGKLHQTATIQLDFQLPRRFGLTYTPESAGTKHGDTLATPVIIHRAVLGSIERFLAILLEQSNGRLPFWLSPRPCIILTVSNDPQILSYAHEVSERLAGNVSPVTGKPYSLKPLNVPSFLIATDSSNNTIGQKIKLAINRYYCFIVVVGHKNVESKTLDVRLQYNPRNKLFQDDISDDTLPSREVQRLWHTLKVQKLAKASPDTLRQLFVYLSNSWW